MEPTLLCNQQGNPLAERVLSNAKLVLAVLAGAGFFCEFCDSEGADPHKR